MKKTIIILSAFIAFTSNAFALLSNKDIVVYGDNDIICDVSISTLYIYEYDEGYYVTGEYQWEISRDGTNWTIAVPLGSGTKNWTFNYDTYGYGTWYVRRLRERTSGLQQYSEVIQIHRADVSINENDITFDVNLCQGYMALKDGTPVDVGSYTQNNGTFSWGWEKTYDGESPEITTYCNNKTSCLSEEDFTVYNDQPGHFTFRIWVTDGTCTNYSDYQDVTILDMDIVGGGTIQSTTDIMCSGSTAGIINNISSTSCSNATGYTWQSATSASGPWTDRASGVTYSPGVLYETTYFRRGARIQGERAYSNTVVVNVHENEPGEIAISGDTKRCYGENLTIANSDAASVTTCGYEYFWEWNLGNGWVEIPGSWNTASFTINNLTQNCSIRRGIIINGTAGTEKYSNIIDVTVQEPTPGEIAIINTTVCKGSAIGDLSSNAAGSCPGYTTSYQWQYSYSASSWANISGATSADYTDNSTSDPAGTKFFRRKLLIAECPSIATELVVTNSVQSEILEPLNGGYPYSTIADYCFGDDIENISLNATNTGRTLTYNWQTKGGSQSTWYDASTSQVFSPGSMDGAIYETAKTYDGVDIRVNITDGVCNATSTTYTISVPSAINPGMIGNDDIICSSFSVSELPTLTQTSAASGGDGSPYNYAWYYRDADSSVWHLMNGKVNSEMTPTELFNRSRIFRRSVHDGCLGPEMTVYSNEVTYTYKDYSIDGMISDIEDCSGTSITLNAGAGYDKYEWNLNNTVFSSGSNSYTKTIAESDNSLALRVTDTDGCEAETSISITAHALPKFAMSDVHICQGSTKTIVAPSGYVQYNFDDNTPTISNTFDLSYADASNNSARTVSVLDDNGCTSGDISYNAYAESLPVVSLSDAYICSGASKTISISASPSITNITWTNLNTSAIVASGPSAYSITVSPEETTSYRVDVENSYCSSYSEMTLTVRENPAIALSDTFACHGNDLVLTANDGYTYHYWSTNNGFEGASTTINVRNNLTVSLRVVDNYACETTETMAIEMKTLPLMEVSTVQGCEGDIVTLSGPVGLSAYLWETGETSREIQKEVLPYGHTGNLIDLTVTDQFGCQSTATGIINTLPSPANPGITTQNMCLGSTLDIYSPNVYSTYLWSTGETTQSITVNYSIDQSMWLKVSNSYGCYDSAAFDVLVHDVPVFEVPDTFKCNDGSALSLDAPLTGSLYNYYWSNGSVSSSSNYNITTSSDLWLEITSGICSTRDTFHVDVHSVPVVMLPDTNICNGDSLIYSYTPSYSSYAWSNGEMTNTLRTKITGNKTFSLTVTDNNGCIGQGTMPVTRLFLPTVYISGESGVCEGNNATLTVSSTFPGILWNTGETSPSITHSISEDTDFSVVVTDVNGCHASSSASVTAFENPIGQLNDTAVCEGDYATLYHPGNYTLSWSTGSTGNNVLFKPINSIEVFLTLTDNNGCFAEDSMYIEVIDIPVVNIPNTAICQNDSALISSPLAFENMLWSTGDTTQNIWFKPTSTQQTLSFSYSDIHGCGSSTNTLVNMLTVTPFSINPQEICQGTSTVISAQLGFSSYLWSTGATTPNITVSPDTTTIYTLDVTDFNGCSERKETFIHVNSVPVFDLADQYICPGASTIINAPVGNYSYLWSTGSTSRYITISHLSPGDYWLKVTNRTTNCSLTDNIEVVTVEAPDQLFSDTSICSGQTIAYTLPDQYQYIWYDGLFGPYKEIAPTTSQEFNVSIVDTFNCTANRAFYVTVFSAPDISTEDVYLCDENTISLSVPFSSGFDYSWSNGSTLTSTSYTVDGQEKAWVRAESPNCGITDTFNIVSEILPVISIQDKVICKGDSLLVDEMPESYFYSWSTGDTSKQVYLKPKDKGTIFVTLSSNHECSKTYDFKASVENLSLIIRGDSTEILSGTDLHLEGETTGGNGISYNWLIGDDDFEGRKIVFNSPDTGSFTVKLSARSENNCLVSMIYDDLIKVISSKADTNGNGGKTSVEALTNAMGVTIYPNPASDVLKIDTKAYEFDNEIYASLIDVTGREVMFVKLLPGTINTLNIRNLKDGVYIIRLQINGLVKTARIIVNQ